MKPPVVVEGKAPRTTPPRVEDFEEYDRKSVDTAIDFIKYVATASGVSIGFYANFLRLFLGDNEIGEDQLAKIIIISPVACWLLAILISVFGVFPRRFIATTDHEKEKAIERLRTLKRSFLKNASAAFVLGFVTFSYVIYAYVWDVYPIDLL